MNQPKSLRGFTCIRTLAFTCECGEDGDSTDHQIMRALLDRLADMHATQTIQDACGPDAQDITADDEPTGMQEG